MAIDLVGADQCLAVVVIVDLDQQRNSATNRASSASENHSSYVLLCTNPAAASASLPALFLGSLRVSVERLLYRSYMTRDSRKRKVNTIILSDSEEEQTPSQVK